MAIHSKVKIWVHLVWSTHKRAPILIKDLKSKLESHLINHAKENGVIINEINIQRDHLHVLFGLPADSSIAKIAKSLKGESSRWINENGLAHGKFRWQRGYGAFSVSASQLKTVVNYIRNQDEHHKKKTFMDEYNHWLKQYGMEKDGND